ncbi:sigma-70 family RNA polymerase sigma factor [Devosia pacifica]|nr:sigma-70 family RNA polymerase sigma factor [Devosia pacifica]
MSEPTSGHLPGTDQSEDPRELIERIAQRRDKAALAALFSLYAPKIKSMMLKLGASNALAEDLVQETLLTVWRKAELYSPQRGAASTWIFTIARNLRIDQLRRQSNKPYEDLEKVELVSDAPIGVSVVEQHQVVDRVGKALADLSEDQREVVRLSFVQDMPHSEISRALGIPLGTVKSRLRLAYDRLRPLLEDLQ